MSYVGAVVSVLAYQGEWVDDVYLYLMKFSSGNEDVYKIGVTIDIETRIRDLRRYAQKRFSTTSGETIFSMLIHKSDVLLIEAAAHKHHRRFKVSYTKEWYRLSDKHVVAFPEFIENARRSVRKTFKQRQQGSDE